MESVTQAVSNLALAFGDDDPNPGAMVSNILFDHWLSIMLDVILLYIFYMTSFKKKN